MTGSLPPRTIIIGGGPGGMCVGIKLQERGLPFTILEKDDGFGGVWRANTYPGCGCDVPSLFFHFSFMPKVDWSQKWAKQSELLEYFESVANKFSLNAHAMFGVEVVSASFSTRTNRWTVTAKHVSDGTTEEFEAEILVSSVGQLSRPVIPHIAGLDTFEGPAFHANRWDHTVELAGKRVAVIGSGATAIQFVPHVVKGAKQTTVFQRSPMHYLCGAEFENEVNPVWFQWVLNNLPGAFALQRAYQFGAMELVGKALGTSLLTKVLDMKLADVVPSKDLRDKLTPRYLPGCKRILIGESNNYLRAIQEPQARLETKPIKSIRPQGIETDAGVEPFDVIVLSTGFNTQDFLAPMSISVDGRDLSSEWKRTPQAHLGMTVAGFLNFFMTYGPNTNTGAGSILFFLECQANYISAMVSQMHAKGYSSVSVRKDAMDSFNARIQASLKNSVFASGCGSWYVNDDGVVTSNWPWSMTSYWRHTRTPDPHEYLWSPSAGVPPSRL